MPVTLSPYALTTLEAAKDHLSVPSGNTTFDDVIKRFINAATGHIETFCDRKFLKRAYTEFQDGMASNRIMLDQWPAEKPSELWIDKTREFTDTAYKLDAADYELDLSARGEGIGVVLTKKNCFFQRGTRNIKIVYNAGFDTIPDELENACLFTVEFFYDMRSDRRVGTQSKGKNQENTTYREDLPLIVQNILLAYKRTEWPTGDRQLMTL